jgi:hypothetical protein
MSVDDKITLELVYRLKRSWDREQGQAGGLLV